MTARRVAWHRARLVEASAETATARRLTFEVPTWPGNDAGAHVDLRLTAPDGYQASRSYSIASSGSGTRLTLVVAEVADGEVSPYLVRDLAVGDEVELQGPLGRYFIWRPDDPAHAGPVQLIGGGSGVVPLIPMAAANEGAERPVEFRLLYSLRTGADAFFGAELAGFGRTRVDVVRTRESDGARPAGRLTQDEFAEATIPAAQSPALFVCGPTPFVETVAAWAVSLGHAASAIRTERFGGG